MPGGIWDVYWTFVAFAYGAIVGSFLNVCIWRLPNGQSVAHPPSHCPSCKHQLRLFPDMVPLLSQAWYRSRCRYCGERFSWRYFGVELLTAVMFAAVYVRFGLDPALGSAAVRLASALTAMTFVAALIVVFFIDLDHYVIHDAVVMVAAGAGVLRDGVMIAAGMRPLWVSVPGTEFQLPIPPSLLLGGLAFWFLWQFAALCTALLAREAMGGGDTVLLAAMGTFLLPWPLLVLALGVAVFLGAFGGMLGLWLHSRRPRQEAAPAVPGDAPGREETEPGTAESAGEPAAAASVGMPEIDAPSPAVEEREMPCLPRESRWGRLLAVVATWMILGALWTALACWNRSPALGLTVGGLLFAAGSATLVAGIRKWRAGDESWQPQMDEFFQEAPGPRIVPFGPYLVAGTFVSMLFGREICLEYARSVLLLSPDALAPLGWR